MSNPKKYNFFFQYGRVSEECHENITRLNALLSDVLWLLREWSGSKRVRNYTKYKKKIQLVNKKKFFFVCKCASNPNGLNWINGKITLCTTHSLHLYTHKKIYFSFSNYTRNVGCNDGFFFCFVIANDFFLVGVLSQNVSHSLFFSTFFYYIFSRDLPKEVLVPVVCLSMTVRFMDGKLLFRRQFTYLESFVRIVAKFR